LEKALQKNANTNSNQQEIKQEIDGKSKGYIPS